MPGSPASKGDIPLSATELSLTISVPSDKRRYYKEVGMPSNLDPDSAKATYENGVLKVYPKKVMKRQGKQLKVE